MPGTDLVAIKAKLAAQAAAAAAEEPQTQGTFLSTKGGVLSFGDEVMPGNMACVIVLDAVRENTFYEGKYNSEDVKPPKCFAFARGDEDMAPHPAMQDHEWFEPQSEECKGCPHNEWGSADTGKGKACQNRRRLALIPAGYYTPRKGSRDLDLHLFDPTTAEGIDHFTSCDIAYIKLPVTSVTNWAKFVNAVGAAQQLPPHGVVTRLFLEPHAKHQYEVCFEVIDVVPDDLLPIIMERNDQAINSTIQPYSGPREEDSAPAGSLKGVRAAR